MIMFEVTDLDAHRTELEAENLATSFPTVKLRPTQFPWGREIHIIVRAGFAGLCGRARVEVTTWVAL
jgi:hypothetical protein